MQNDFLVLLSGKILTKNGIHLMEMSFSIKTCFCPLKLIFCLETFLSHRSINFCTQTTMHSAKNIFHPTEIHFAKNDFCLTEVYLFDGNFVFCKKIYFQWNSNFPFEMLLFLNNSGRFSTTMQVTISHNSKNLCIICIVLLDTSEEKEKWPKAKNITESGLRMKQHIVSITFAFSAY